MDMERRRRGTLVGPCNADDGADAVTRMASLPAEKRIRVGAAPRRSSRKRAGAAGTALTRGRLRLTSHAAQEFLGRVRIFRIGFIAPRLTDLGHGATHSLHQFARNLRKEPRRQGSPELLLVAKNAPIHRARESKRFSRPRHSDVPQAALFLSAFFFIQGAAVRGDGF